MIGTLRMLCGVISRTPDDCSFPTGSKAAVLLTYFSGKVDPHSLMMKQAGELNMTVYMGLPQPPYIGM